MQENKQQIVGSSTACLMMLCHSDLKLYTANIGDSGFLVVRCGEVVHRSQEQQHYFNTPFQLSLPPTELQSEVLADRPDAADQYAFSVEDGDVILLATDGIFDNVPDRLLVEEMDKVQHCKDEVVLQQSANTIALMARRLSRDSQVTVLYIGKSHPSLLSCFLKLPALNTFNCHSLPSSSLLSQSTR